MVGAGLVRRDCPPLDDRPIARKRKAHKIIMATPFGLALDPSTVSEDTGRLLREDVTSFLEKHGHEIVSVYPYGFLVTESGGHVFRGVRREDVEPKVLELLNEFWGAWMKHVRNPEAYERLARLPSRSSEKAMRELDEKAIAVPKSVLVLAVHGFHGYADLLKMVRRAVDTGPNVPQSLRRPLYREKFGEQVVSN